MNRIGEFIQTFTGRRFYPLDPRPNEIDIEDIAHALSNLCRFGGHCSSFYSVAEHSVCVSRACHREDALWGLLHDASEAYLVDLPAPLKRSLVLGPAYVRTEARLLSVICQRFGLTADMPESVAKADKSMLRLERYALMMPGIHWAEIDSVADDYAEQRLLLLSPGDAKAAFLSRFKELTQ